MACRLCQIPAVPLQRLISSLGSGRGHALAAANLAQRLGQPFARNAHLGKNSPSSAFVVSERQQEVFHRDIFVFEPLGFVFGFDEQPVQPPGDIHLVGRPAAGAGNLWQPAQLLLHSLQ